MPLIDWLRRLGKQVKVFPVEASFQDEKFSTASTTSVSLDSHNTQDILQQLNEHRLVFREDDAVSVLTDRSSIADDEMSSEEDFSQYVVSSQIESESIDSLYNGIVLNDNGFTLSAIRNTLALLNRVLSAWDEMKASNRKDQIFYEKGRRAFLVMQDTVEKMLHMPLPESEFEKLTFKAQNICIEEVFTADKSEMAKSFLIIALYQQYLENLSYVYLFDESNHKVESTVVSSIREEAKSTYDILTQKINKSVYSFNEEYRKYDRQAIWCVVIREKREANFIEHPCEKSTDIVLQELQESSLEFLRSVINLPHSYLPIKDKNDLTEVFLDLCYSADPSGYVQLTKEPKMFNKLLGSFVFSSPEVLHYFSERYHSADTNNLGLIEQKNKLLAIVEQQFQLKSELRLKPIALSCLWNNSKTIIPVTNNADYLLNQASVKI
jgi:hypothetical protein